MRVASGLLVGLSTLSAEDQKIMRPWTAPGKTKGIALGYQPWLKKVSIWRISGDMSSEGSYHMESLHMMCLWRPLGVYFYGLAVKIAITPDDIHHSTLHF